MRLTYPRADLVLAASAAIVSELKAFFGDRCPPISVLHNAINADMIRSRLGCQEPRLQPALGQKKLRIVGVGRLSPVKDFGTLLLAVVELQKRGWSVEARIVGSGPELNRLLALAVELGLQEPTLVFIGQVVEPWQHMRDADVLVLASVTEGYPLVLLEAMACGCQVVSTDCRGPIEALAAGRYGELAQVGNPIDIADAIERVLAAPRSPEVLAEGVERYGPKQVAGRMLSLISSLQMGGPPDRQSS